MDSGSLCFSFLNVYTLWFLLVFIGWLCFFFPWNNRNNKGVSVLSSLIPCILPVKPCLSFPWLFIEVDECLCCDVNTPPPYAGLSLLSTPGSSIQHCLFFFLVIHPIFLSLLNHSGLYKILECFHLTKKVPWFTFT